MLLRLYRARHLFAFKRLGQASKELLFVGPHDPKRICIVGKQCDCLITQKKIHQFRMSEAGG